MTESPEILTPKRNVVLDSQVLSTLMSCPRLCDLRFNRNFTSTTGKSKSLNMGSVVHSFLEGYYGSIINGVSRAQAEGFGHTKALEYAGSDECRGLEPADLDWALDTCHQYCDFYKNDFWVPLEVETVKSKLIYEDDEIRIIWKAKLDSIFDTNQGIFPVDHKTMSQRRDLLSLNNQFMGQCILMDTRLMFINKIGFQKTLKAAEKFVRATVSYTADRLLEWQDTILPYYAKFYTMYADSEYYPPNFTHCENKYGFCQFKEVCESDRGMREEVIGANFIVGKKWDISNNEE